MSDNLMSFASFAVQAAPSASVNKWPVVGKSEDVVSYSVYMNGPAVAGMPKSITEHQYRDIALHALTEKLGLDSRSSRDNLAVAEVLALRHAFMSMVLEASLTQKLSDEILRDYDLLSENEHPYFSQVVKGQLSDQKTLGELLIETAVVTGKEFDMKDASGTNSGPIISQNNTFSIQSVGDGTVIAHENKRLDSTPKIGDDITIFYYRGNGQVFSHDRDMEFGQPYIDSITKDLAVPVFQQGNDSKPAHVLLFSEAQDMAQFVREKGLGMPFLVAALSLSAEQKKLEVDPSALQTLHDAPYIDPVTNSPAFNYSENAVLFTSIFRDTESLRSSAINMGADETFLKQINGLENSNPEQSRLVASSRIAMDFVQSNEFTSLSVDTNRGNYAGKVVKETLLHVVQEVGRNEVAIHDKRNLSKVPMSGERISIKYDKGRGDTRIRGNENTQSVSR